MSRTQFRAFLLFPLVACSGDDNSDDTAAEPVESYACVHIAEGGLVDFAPDRAEAGSITVGREPWRVNVIRDTVGFVAFGTDAPVDLVLQLDFARAVTAVWSDDARTALDPGDPNPNCDTDIPEVLYLSVPAGEHQLEVGPIFQGNVWLMLSEP